MGNRLSTFDNRIVYENAKIVCAAANVDISEAILTQSSLRLEQQLSTTVSKYTFGVLVNDNGPAGTKFNTEVRLNQQDAFISSALCLYLGEPSSATDTTWIDHTYPNPSTFSASGEAAALETIYKSQIRITVNNRVVMPTLYTSRFRRVTTSQKVTAAANQNGIGNDEIDMATDGLMLAEPNIVLIGSKQNLIEVSLPTTLAAIGTAGFTRLVLEFRGLLAQNSTIIT